MKVFFSKRRLFPPKALASPWLSVDNQGEALYIEPYAWSALRNYRKRLPWAMPMLSGSEVYFTFNDEEASQRILNMEYLFTLKYQLAECDSDLDVLVERLGVAGCDDALAGLGQPGRLALEFSREANSAEEAVRSALADVKKAIPSAYLIEASPDLVGLTDVAEVISVSRQAVRKLMLSHRATFPVPVHEGSSSIWHLAEVLDWLKSRGHYHIDVSKIETAKVALEINIAKEGLRHPIRSCWERELLTA